MISTLDIVIRTMKQVYDAHERQQNISKVLQIHEEELYNIRQILKVVRQEEVLQVVAILEDLKQLRMLGGKLEVSLKQYGKDSSRGQVKQFANQLLNGRKLVDDLGVIMGSMSRAKANLHIKIQVVHIGLTSAFGGFVVVNCERVEMLDQKLQKLLGQGKGLKLAELLRHKPRRSEYESPGADVTPCTAQVSSLDYTSHPPGR